MCTPTVQDAMAIKTDYNLYNIKSMQLLVMFLAVYLIRTFHGKSKTLWFVTCPWDMPQLKEI
jgi:hypothetical protein